MRTLRELSTISTTNNFAPHQCEWTGIRKIPTSFDLLMAVGEGLVKEQFMEFFQMENKNSEPKHKNFTDIGSKSPEEQKSSLAANVIDFMMYFGYCNADTGLPHPLRGSLHYQMQKSDEEKSVDPNSVC